MVRHGMAAVTMLAAAVSCNETDGEPAPQAEPTVALRNPESGQCEEFADGDPAPSWATCDSHCADLDLPTCRATIGCRTIFVETCPPDAACEPGVDRVYAGCWALDQAGPPDPIEWGCEGRDPWSCSRMDDCEAIHYDTCGGDPNEPCVGYFFACRTESTQCTSDVECTPDSYCNLVTGWCIHYPADWCVTPDPAECLSRHGCAPLFEGQNCTCTLTGCDCTGLAYVTCHTSPGY